MAPVGVTLAVLCGAVCGVSYGTVCIVIRRAPPAATFDAHLPLGRAPEGEGGQRTAVMSVHFLMLQKQSLIGSALPVVHLYSLTETDGRSC